MREEKQPDQDRQQRDQPAQPGQLSSQRGDGLAGGLGEPCDLAELGVHAGGEDDGLRLTGHDRGAGQQDVLAADRLIGVGRRLRPAPAAPIRR